MVTLQYINIALRFLLELCALASLGYWGICTGKGTGMKMVLGIGAPFLVAVIWGMFGSPKAMVKLPVLFHLIVEMSVFGMSVIALYFAGQQQLAWIYGLSVVINRILMVIWRQ